MRKEKIGLCIGVLDIYGFEIFEVSWIYLHDVEVGITATVGQGVGGLMDPPLFPWESIYAILVVLHPLMNWLSDIIH